jgi:hypothetical protein
MQGVWLDWYAALGPATWANWSLAVLALIAGIIGYRTLKAMNTQIRFGETTANAAIRAAKAAEESNEQAREMAQVELRAYVYVTNVGRSDEPRYKGQPIDKLIVTFRNFGRTPAFKFRVKRNWKLLEGFEAELPENFDYPDFADKERFSEMTLGPDIDTPIESYIDPNDVTKAQQRTHTLYIYGTAEYEDVFGKPHTTPYCFVLHLGPDRRGGFIVYEKQRLPT